MAPPSLSDLRIEDFIPAVPELFRDAQFYTCVGFQKAKIPVAAKPDPAVKDGGRICASASTRDGRLAVATPIALSGFSVWKLFTLDRILATPKGHVALGNRWLRVDLTKTLRATALGSLFPQGKVQPIPLVELFRKKLKPTSQDRRTIDALLGAAKVLAVQTKICAPQDPTCSTPQASLALYLDIPQVLKTYAAGGFQQFDFRGVHQDSFLQWTNFPLSSLPWPNEIRASRGTADISASYDPSTGITRIALKKINLDLLLPKFFGDDPVTIVGNVEIELQAGGRIKVNLEKVNVRRSQNPVVNATLDLRIVYDPENFLRPIWTEWNLVGQLSLDLANQHLEFKNIKTEGRGGWGFGQGNLMLRLDDFQAKWSSGVSWQEGGQNRLVAEKVLLTLTGKGREEDADIIRDEADLSVEFLKSQISNLAITPSVNLSLRSTRLPAGNGLLLEANGEIRLSRSEKPRLDLVSSVSGQTDFQNFEWRAIMRGDQRLSDFRSQGELQIEGDHNLSLKVLTKKPLRIFYQNKTLASGIRISGRSGVGGSRFQFSIPWIRPQHSESLNLKNMASRLSVSKRVGERGLSFSGMTRANLDGRLMGPVALDYRGYATWNLERPSLWITLSPRSSFVLGPLNSFGLGPSLEGEAALTGALGLYPTEKGMSVVGRKIGIREGMFTLQADSLGMGSLSLKHGSFLADRFRGVRRGIAYGGGDGFTLESDLLWKNRDTESRRHVRLSFDRLFLSLDAFWKLFQDSLKQMGEKPEVTNGVRSGR